jgi:hypothetical protein
MLLMKFEIYLLPRMMRRRCQGQSADDAGAAVSKMPQLQNRITHTSPIANHDYMRTHLASVKVWGYGLQATTVWPSGAMMSARATGSAAAELRGCCC